MTKASHPPTLETLVKRLWAEYPLAEPGDTVLVAVSGGPDSMALLHILARNRERFCIHLVAHGVDHGLRKAAVEELALAEKLAVQLAVPFDTTRVNVDVGGNLQARARKARYQALEAAAERYGAQRIATAHHADDRAETIIMRLLRGSSPRGLACLPPVENNRIRPMLLARRKDVELHVARHQLQVAHDPSNRDPRYLRTAVREEVLPLLERLSPAAVKHLITLADELSALDPTQFPKGVHQSHRQGARRAYHLGQPAPVVLLPNGQQGTIEWSPEGYQMKQSYRRAIDDPTEQCQGSSEREHSDKGCSDPMRFPS